MNKYLFIFYLFLFFLPISTFAQTGSIQGQIIDTTANEGVIGANVVIKGTTIGSSTDIEGNYLIPNVAAGTYTIVISSIGYRSKEVEGVVVQAGKVITLNVKLSEDAKQLDDVVVQAERETYSEISVISEIKLSQVVAVGISGEQISRNQDRDAASVIRRIPGISLMDNRFIMVRGLGQRYNTVMLNDIITPSSEVDTRAFSFDIVPSNIIDRMFVYKSGAGDLPGDFAGGVVKIYTKDAPQENFTNISFTTGYRLNTTFESVQKYEGGKLDWLGFDDGGRQLPNGFPGDREAFARLSSTQTANLNSQFEGKWSTQEKTVPLDLRFNFNIGRRFKLGNMTVGNLSSVNYSNTQQFAAIDFDFYENTQGNEGFVGQLSRSFDDRQITNNIRLGILHNWLFRFDAKNSLEFKNLFNQLTFSETVLRSALNINDGTLQARRSLRFENRSIYSGQLIGKHELSDKFNFNWTVGYSYTNRQEPDWRRLVQNIDNGGVATVVLPGAPTARETTRFFSNLNEHVISGNLAAELRLSEKEDEKASKLKFGAYLERKNREFQARFFGYRPGQGNYSGIDPDLLLSPIYVTANDLIFTEGTKSEDKYDASNTLFAPYVSYSLPITSKFTMVAGLRTEYNIQQLSTIVDNLRPIDISKGIFSLLPSLNLIYDITDKSLIRFGYSSTVNRPELRELAPFQFYDFNLDAIVRGNTDLTTATIQNVDVRWEYYPTPGELISIGAFYKYLNKPIENILTNTTGPGLDYTFINSRYAQNYGLEVEFRKNLNFMAGSFWKNLNLVANASVIYSQVILPDVVNIPQPDGSFTPVNSNELVDATSRPLMFQSPYLINAGFYYNNEDKGWQINLLYNVFGQRIFALGNDDNPTIYEIPRNVIDINISKTLGKHWEIRFTAQDLLNQRFLYKQDSNRNGKVDKEDKDIRSFRRGQYLSLGAVFNF
jgi:TonB-dependent receptor